MKSHKKRVRVKIEHDRAWKPTLYMVERYWVIMTSGISFYIGKTPGGSYHSEYAQHMSLPSLEAAVEDGLTRYFGASCDDPRDAYRRTRARERVFTISLAKSAKTRR
jgi:hypothetical protein